MDWIIRILLSITVAPLCAALITAISGDFAPNSTISPALTIFPACSTPSLAIFKDLSFLILLNRSLIEPNTEGNSLLLFASCASPISLSICKIVFSAYIVKPIPGWTAGAKFGNNPDEPEYTSKEFCIKSTTERMVLNVFLNAFDITLSPFWIANTNPNTSATPISAPTIPPVWFANIACTSECAAFLTPGIPACNPDSIPSVIHIAIS